MTMEIVVQGRNVAVDPAVDADSRRKLAKLSRLASDIRRIDVEFSEVRNPRVADSHECEVTVHLTRNLVKAHAAAADARTALDRVVDKVGHQLHRVHDKRVAPLQAPPFRRPRAPARAGRLTAAARPRAGTTAAVERPGFRPPRR